MVFNPYSNEISEEERNPAKIWELLRQNKEFRQAVEKLQAVEARIQQADRKNDTRAFKILRKLGLRMIERACPGNPFGRTALEWLVPDPRITIIETIRNVDGQIPSERTVTILPADLAIPEDQWPWRLSDQRPIQGPTRRGPEIIYLRNTDEQFTDRAVILDAWRSWEPGTQLFTVDTPWNACPAGFRSRFSHLWRRYDSRAKNPVTGNRSDSPEPFEFSLKNVLNPQTEEHMHEVITFLLYRLEGYRFIAVPDAVISNGGAAELGQWLTSHLEETSRHLKKRIPAKTRRPPEIIGSETDWRVWKSSFNSDKKSTELKPFEKDSRTLNSRDRKALNYMKHLRNSVFPDFDLVTLVAPALHRSHRSS